MYHKVKISLLFIMMSCLLLSGASIANRALSFTSMPFSTQELTMIKQYLFNNITTKDRIVIKEGDHRIIRSIPGAVLASPSNKYGTFTQDYQFHWVRDAAITMNEVVYLYAQGSVDEKKSLRPYLINYVSFEHKAQQQIAQSSQPLGEPKYNIDGTVWEGAWGRPQNDGPALRAITLMMIAHLFLQENDEKFVRENLFNMIILDLDYIVSKWRETSFDLWEEVNDQDFFFTKMVQRKALVEGADFVRNIIGDYQRADFYLSVANQLTNSLQKHWNPGRGYFTETVNQQFYKSCRINYFIIFCFILYKY